MAQSNNAASFEDHALYHEATELIAAGDQVKAARKLRVLIELYPEEPLLQELLVRTQLRATLADSEPAPVVHSAPTRSLRGVVLVLLAITVCLVVVAGFAAAYDQIVSPAKESRQLELRIDALKQDGQARLEAGDWLGAREAFEELLTLVPNDATAQAGIQLSQQYEVLDQQYADAVAAEQRGDPETALLLLRQIKAQSPGYRDVQQRIADLEEQAALEAAWLQSESYIQAGDWLGAIGTLTQIRGQNPSFRRAQVEEQLYQVYAQIARELIAQANGSVDTLRQAVGYLDSALALRPTQKDLLEERRLAYEFVAGEDAWAKQDWASAAAHWETVYATRPDYQGGVLRDKLRQAYPLAARQLIAEAQGRVSLLNQAVAYLDQALLAQPDNQELVEERQLLLEFIAGAQAFEQRAWDIAISHWGAIYLVRPAYQDGALEEQLRLACQRSSEPDESLCPP